MSRQITKQDARQQQLQQSEQHARDVDTQEHHSKAEASAGLNLNLFGALSGALSSKSKKTTQQNADGSSLSVEERNDKAAASGAARGQGMAYAKGNAEQHDLKSKSKEIGQSAQQAKKVEGSKQVDHLGIEA